MNEADTCRTYILPKLKDADWEDDAILEQVVLTPGRIVPLGGSHTRKAGLRPDYVLCIRRNIPIAVIEAKAEYKHPAQGLQQALQYAGMMGLKFAYACNGKEFVEHDFITGQERTLDKFQLEEQRRLVAYLDGLQAQVSQLRAHQAETHKELDALMPGILDKAFKGEL
jgi:type I restriction enzyme, R subunit